MAGVSTKEIKSRIRSMESTKQITKAMEMVAASKLRRAQAKIANSRPYFETIYAALQDIVAAYPDDTAPYFTSLREAPKHRVVYVVIAGDRGLAGGYNSNILKLAYGEMQQGEESVVLPIGKKALEFFQARRAEIYSDSYPEAEDVSISDCFSMAKQLCKEFRWGKVDEIRLAYTQFESVLSQKPCALRLLPLESEKRESKKDTSAEVLYDPDPADVLHAITPEYVGGLIYGALCESRASEQAARRTAMDSATQNADDMIADLSLKFNRARQAAITQEITEIVAGS